MGLDFEYKPGQTPLDEDEKEGLLVKTVSTQEELDQLEQQNIEKGILWTIHQKTKPDDILTEGYVKKLHVQMFGDVWKWAGKFRQTNKNIGSDWPKIVTELKTLLEDTKFWIQKDTFDTDEITIRFKHRLVCIHCFPNGNGRHSRILADIIAEKILEIEPYSWGQQNMVRAGETRNIYISALRKADRGDFGPLKEFARS
jgi:Fic-DOC domain mobile mystery protein B